MLHNTSLLVHVVFITPSATKLITRPLVTVNKVNVNLFHTQIYVYSEQSICEQTTEVLMIWMFNSTLQYLFTGFANIPFGSYSKMYHDTLQESNQFFTPSVAESIATVCHYYTSPQGSVMRLSFHTQQTKSVLCLTTYMYQEVW